MKKYIVLIAFFKLSESKDYKRGDEIELEEPDADQLLEAKKIVLAEGLSESFLESLKNGAKVEEVEEKEEDKNLIPETETKTKKK